MLNFKDNFFFSKFAVLFFLLVIFGYWGIDLNSEELFIAFSFLFLVVFAFVSTRVGVSYAFIKMVNKKYSRQLSSYFYLIGHLELQKNIVSELVKANAFFLSALNLLVILRNNLASFNQTTLTLRVRNLVLAKLSVFSGLLFFFSEKSKLRRFLGFRQQAAKAFKLDLLR